ncbi:bifunctional ADP-dependent NAD(P)H-hydrate dehydratase/NAD(P)H-hydrate epimerase [Serinibacter salmoneus]|uniref:Bifunctional NAD(P)H-hydrate repair enzyme n=1 Tax=Serinibacter salmoneus TaxID=556530 RepID=A0A2A9CX22_9MICO|nr:bifunctional ADP-dependent NAD(P)H-hydrate dehydratase/NAD(P)H-hydrate epimerase [Serinibacter salmoneus]PFG18974.1 hydroxyethylthiazole kinase-like uncharacterized protein yjeF/hydroxyethylthiazole kinase-like uncharacterized protein yjeF [Serinibacter salmoneus]
MRTAHRVTDVVDAETPLLAAGVPLMERASFALALAVASDLRARRGRVVGARIGVLVGGGNNGGDALIAAAHLARRGAAVEIVGVGRAMHEAGAARARAAGARFLDADQDAGELAGRLAGCAALLDGITGIGASSGLRGRALEVVTALRGAMASRPRGERPWVVAVDVPSGVGVDDGALPEGVLPADRTVTMGTAKPALLLPPAEVAAGEVTTVALGLDLTGASHAVVRLEAGDLAEEWAVPGPADHKYTRGVLGIAAGSDTYPGAAVLATSAAVRAGAGMVRYAGPDAAAAQVLTRHPEVVRGLGEADQVGRVQAWLLGSGVGAGDTERLAWLERTLTHAVERGIPVVADAGALAVLPERLPATVLLTPHAGELAGLLAARDPRAGWDRARVEALPVRALRRAVDLTGATVLLKGATTLVAGPSGPVHSQAEATPWLGTAGAGDVLAGLAGMVLASRAGDLTGAGADPELTARLGAVAASVHGRAARRAAGVEGAAGVEASRTRRAPAGGSVGGPITALDVAEALPSVIRDLLDGTLGG